MSAATRNRVAPYLDPPRPPLPATRPEREEALADGVFAAVGALRQLLTHPDAAVVLRAAAMLLDFEKTRLRHARPVAGTKPDPLPDLEPLTPPKPTAAFHDEDEEDDEDKGEEAEAPAGGAPEADADFADWVWKELLPGAHGPRYQGTPQPRDSRSKHPPAPEPRVIRGGKRGPPLK